MSVENLEAAVADWVKSLRHQSKLNVWNFAQKIGVDAGTVSRLENGRTQVLLDTIVRLCKGAGVSPEEFIKRFLKSEPSPLLTKAEVSSDGGPLLTIQDIEYFLEWFRHDPKEGARWMMNSLNKILDTLNREGNDILVKNPPFTEQNIEHLLITSPAYKFEFQYPSEIDNKTILRIYSLGGVLTPIDVGTFLRNLRSERRVILSEMSKTVGRSKSLLSNVEIGAIERIKLLDVLLMDDFYQQDGKVFTLFWRASEFNNRITQSDRWTERETKIGSLLVTIARWLQFLDWDDQSWISELRKKVQEGAGEAQLEPVA